MFACVSWYEDQSYYDEHPVMYLMTPEAAYRIELFSGYITTMDSSAYMQNFGGSKEHTEWLKEVRGRSDFRANLEVSAYDRVITLSYHAGARECAGIANEKFTKVISRLHQGRFVLRHKPPE